LLSDGEARYDVRGLLRLHKIVKDLGLGEREIIKVLELAKHNELERLQWKVEYLRNEVDMLENEKWKSTTHILKLNRMTDELQSLPHKELYDNTHNILYNNPQTYTNSYSIQLSYSDYLP